LKTGRIGAVCFQKWQALRCRLFIRELLIRNTFGGLKKGKIGPGRISKALSADLRNPVSKRSKRFELE
jgi:hypothetical protein